MKTFLEITKQIARQPWSIEDPDFLDIEALFDDSPKLINATQKANSFIFRTYDFSFKKRSIEFDTNTGRQNYEASAGNITNVFCEGNSNPLLFDAHLQRLRNYEGRPVRYNRTLYNSQDAIFLHPVPDGNYHIFIEFDTLKTAKRLDGDKYIEIDNLEKDNDILNVPQQYEDIYLQALYAKTMVYLIQDNTDENYAPYESSFQEALKVLLKNSSSISGETRFVI